MKRKDINNELNISISRPNYNKYLYQWKKATEKVKIPFSMKGVKLKKYLDRRTGKYY